MRSVAQTSPAHALEPIVGKINELGGYVVAVVPAPAKGVGEWLTIIANYPDLTVEMELPVYRETRSRTIRRIAEYGGWVSPTPWQQVAMSAVADFAPSGFLFSIRKMLTELADEIERGE